MLKETLINKFQVSHQFLLVKKRIEKENSPLIKSKLLLVLI